MTSEDKVTLFTAKYKGWCHGCGRAFDSGDSVRYVDGELHGEACCSTADGYVIDEIGHRPPNVCTQCFTIHAGECL